MEKSRGAKIKGGEIRGYGPRGAKIRWTKNEWSENLREAKFEKNKVVTYSAISSWRVFRHDISHTMLAYTVYTVHALAFILTRFNEHLSHS